MSIHSSEYEDIATISSSDEESSDSSGEELPLLGIPDVVNPLMDEMERQSAMLEKGYEKIMRLKHQLENTGMPSTERKRKQEKYAQLANICEGIMERRRMLANQIHEHIFIRCRDSRAPGPGLSGMADELLGLSGKMDELLEQSRPIISMEQETQAVSTEVGCTSDLPKEDVDKPNNHEHFIDAKKH